MCNEAGPKVVHCSISEFHLTTALKRLNIYVCFIGMHSYYTPGIILFWLN